MANFHIAFDNDNEQIGYYFEKSKADIAFYINQAITGSTITEISSKKCNQAYIDILIPKVNHTNFIFLAYSHGDTNCLIANGNYYIESHANANLFGNSLFYSMACHTGTGLGVKLIEFGSHAFIGFTNAAYALLGSNTNISLSCDNYGMKCFIDGATLLEAFESMKNNFTTQSDILELNGEILAASQLRKNRDALILLGNGALTINDFIHV